ncbi:sugar porter family MFS transporter [Paenibacillus aurantius]|uniref:Sugar porter family MFS transporter n=1 Tax=Paenibacillus aurantius TaxID=2918900 RepID=A0AA96LBY9_9BACL|nr:sugar porter family MFS transporter [Paenibacillus aurantius]WNQ10328.1 sugar porter family MFS transporter [Paenibacillus aurantius]
MTNPRPPKRKAFSLFSTVYSIIAAIGGFLFGYDTAVISGAVGFIQERFDLNPGMLGWMVSSLIVGAAAGAAFSGVLSDKFGRKKMLIASALIFVAGSIGSAIPSTVTGLIVARIIGGIGVGMASTLAPLYISEIAPARIRGRLVSIYQFAVVTGIFVTFFINAQIAGFGDNAWDVSTAWRWMLGFGIAPGILYMLLLLFIPETPRWLMKNKQEVRALEVLERMNGKEAAKADLHEIMNLKESDEGSFRDLFRRALRQPLLVGVALAVLQQITGINAIMYYAPEIFKQTGAGTNAALTQTILVGLVNFAFTLVALWLIDKAGRKALLLVGSTLMTVCLAVVGYGFHSPDMPGSWILFFILLYVAAFAVSLGPVVWVMISEIFPTRVRGRATAFAALCLWLADYLVSQTFPMLLDGIGTAATFWLFGAISLVGVFFCAKAVPETKGKSLEEIEQYWADRS